VLRCSERLAVLLLAGFLLPAVLAALSRILGLLAGLVLTTLLAAMLATLLRVALLLLIRVPFVRHLRLLFTPARPFNASLQMAVPGGTDTKV
jgi:hypothetical protein